MARIAVGKPRTVHQLKVTLLETKPPVWRRVLVPSNYTLNQVHAVIQASMGWTNSHLHQFEVDERVYSDPDFELDEYGDEIGDEYRVRLSKVAPEAGARLGYWYDFGDNWRHVVLVEKILPAEEGVAYPRCVTGRRAGPPDDCGGTWGFEEFVKVMADPGHPEHDSMAEWYGREFDPQAVDLEAINEQLADIGRGRSIFLGPYE